MNEVFLSASVPVKGRGDFYKDADPYLIQFAVREFVLAILGRQKIVFGGHPAITPMIVNICKDLGLNFTDCVLLYQSKYFAGQYPEANAKFSNIIYTDAVDNDRKASLIRMREEMLSRSNLTAAIFIGGMEGVLEEYELFTRLHPDAAILAVTAPGGAAKQLAERLPTYNTEEPQGMDFARLFYNGLKIDPREQRKV